MKTFKKNAFSALLIGSFIALVAVFSPIVPATYAQCSNDINDGAQGGVGCAEGADVPDTLFGANSIFTTVVNILLFIIGAISVIMLIIGGIRYTLSGGDSGNVTSAKNTILYAIIGLLVAFFAFAIVNWVLGAVTF